MLSGGQVVLQPLRHGSAQAHEQLGQRGVVRRVVPPQELTRTLLHGRVHAPLRLAQALGPLVTYCLAIETLFRVVPVGDVNFDNESSVYYEG